MEKEEFGFDIEKEVSLARERILKKYYKTLDNYYEPPNNIQTNLYLSIAHSLILAGIRELGIEKIERDSLEEFF